VSLSTKLNNLLGIPPEAEYSFKWDITAGAMVGIFVGIAFPFFTRIAKDLHAPDSAILLMTIAPFVGNLFSPFWARQMDGHSKLSYCVFGWSGARALMLLTPFVITAWHFTGMIAIMQLIFTITMPAYISMMKDIYPDRSRGRMMGYVRAALQTTALLATLVSGYLLDHGVSFRILFPIAAVIGIFSAFCFGRVRALKQESLQGKSEKAPDTPTVPITYRNTLGILKTNVPYRWFAISVMVYGLGNLMAQPLYGLYQIERFHASNTQISYLANIAAIFGVAGNFFWGRYMDKHSPPHTVLMSIYIAASISAVYFLAPTLQWLYIAAALTGFGFAGIELSYMASILLYAEPGRAAQYQSLHALLVGIRGIIAPLIAIPLMRHTSYETAFTATLVLMLLGGFCQRYARHQHHVM
jgi:MFS family permease